MTVKTVLVAGLIAGLSLFALPAVAQDLLAARVLTDVCLPYAGRSQSFEKSIRAARELDFRRPVGATGRLEEWASEVDLVSDDGAWMLRIEEKTVEDGETAVYTVGCTLSSRRASARDLADLGRRAFRDERYWTTTPDNPWRWNRRTANPEEYGLAVEVSERPGDRPAMTINGFYY